MPQKIIGNSARQPNDVSLQKPPDGIGDSLSVHLAQSDPSSAAVWRLEVYVHIGQGTFFLGEMFTTPPSLGRKAARTVLTATCPAATGWSILATCPTEGEEAYLTLDSSKCCAGTTGIRDLDGDSGGSEETPWLQNFSTALANTFTIFAGPCILRSITARVDGTLANGTYYLQLWNAIAAPADGTAVSQLASLLAPVKVVHVLNVDDSIRIDYNEKGVRATIGAFMNLSSTEFTKTQVAGSNMSVLSAEFRLP